MISLALVLALSLGAEKTLDCDKVASAMADKCIESCKKKIKRHDASANSCSAQCETLVASFKDRCKKPASIKSDPAKAMEIKKKLAEEDQ